MKSVESASRKSNRRSPATTVAHIALCWAVMTTLGWTDQDSASADARIAIQNGDQIRGRVLANDSGDSIQFLADGFLEPFEFPLWSIRSIRFDREELEAPTGEFTLVCVNGDSVTGNLKSWNEDGIRLESERVGEVFIRTDAIARMFRAQNGTDIAPMILDGLSSWSEDSPGYRSWQEVSGRLVTGSAGAALGGDWNLPPRAMIEVELSWKQDPNFVLAIAVDPQRSVDRPTDGWRLETTDQNLLLIREKPTEADLEVIADLKGRSQVDLVIYVDQSEQRATVFDAEGSRLGSVGLVASREANTQTGIRVINRGLGLTINKLRVAPWNGLLPGGVSGGSMQFLLDGGELLGGSIASFDPSTQSLTVANETGNQSIDIRRISAVDMGRRSGDESSEPCTLVIPGGERLSGSIQSVTADHWILQGPHLNQQVLIPRSAVRSLITGDPSRLAEPQADSEVTRAQGPIGRFEAASQRILGRLADTPFNDTPANSSPLSWQPIDSLKNAAIAADASGRIRFRGVKLPGDSGKPKRSGGLDFGDRFLRSVTRVNSKLADRDDHVVYLRNGDVMELRVETIDKSGIYVATPESDDGFIPNANIKAIKFDKSADIPKLDDAKRERLLSLPRLQKQAPPTHLLCAVDGDLLRCRLLRASADTIEVEVQKAYVDVPRARISQVIWLHPEPIERGDDDAALDEKAPLDDADPSTLEPLEGRVQVLSRSGKRITLTPSRVVESTLVGNNAFVGECRIPVSNLDQLILGEEISAQDVNLAYRDWKLTPAIEPLVMREPVAEADVGLDSPLVGLAAPELNAPLLDGGRFRLADCNGQVIVLDFWATWCAPCIRNMPMLRDAVSKFDPNQVRLISVNVEEPPAQIREFLVQNDLDVTVALDVDSMIAQRFEVAAIPQTVIIDGQGRVARVFKGGGDKTVERVTGAIRMLIATDPPSSAADSR